MRRFEFSEGKSNKFWEVDIGGTSVIVRYGRIGTSGTFNIKEFPDLGKAIKHRDKMISQKTSKGYKEIDGVMA